MPTPNSCTPSSTPWTSRATWSGCTTTVRSSDSALPSLDPSALLASSSRMAISIRTPSAPSTNFSRSHGTTRDPTRRHIAQHVTLDGFRSEFRGELPDDIADRISPDLWTLHWSLMSAPDRVANLIRLLEDQPSTLEWFPKEQAYLREHQPPALVIWGPHDGYMPEESARAYHRDLPDAPLHLLGGGHWLLETHLDEVVPLVDDFLRSAYGR